MCHNSSGSADSLGNIPAAVPNWEWECNKSEAAEEPDNATLNLIAGF